MFIAIIALFAGANFYVFYRLWHLTPPVGAARWIVLGVGLAATACAFLYFAVAGKSAHWLASAVYRIGMSWLMIFIYILIAFLLLDLLRVTKLVPMEWMKTGSWAALGIFALVMAVVFSIGNIVFYNKKRVAVEIATGKLPAGTPPVKVVAVSDLHLGYGIGRKELSGWVDMINAERPDAVVIAGDLIDTHLRPLWDKDMAAELKRLDAPLGIYACPGNHEYISGADESRKFYEAAGITYLSDSSALVGNSFYIVGRDDRTNTKRKDLALLKAGLGEPLPVIVLDHQPYHLEEAEAAGVDLQFSGHTHKGQIWPISWITSAIFEKDHGYLNKGNTHYFVSSGLGIWGGKFRIGSRSEYVVFTIM